MMWDKLWENNEINFDFFPAKSELSSSSTKKKSSSETSDSNGGRNSASPPRRQRIPIEYNRSGNTDEIFESVNASQIQKETDYLLNKYQNRATILENTLKAKLPELETTTRRLDILQNVVKQLKDREIGFQSNVTQLTEELHIEQNMTQYLGVQLDHFQVKSLSLENKTNLLELELNLTDQKYLKLEQKCLVLTKDLETQNQLIIQKDEELKKRQEQINQEISTSTGGDAHKSKEKDIVTSKSEPRKDEIIQLNKQIQSLSKQLKYVQDTLNEKDFKSESSKAPAEGTKINSSRETQEKNVQDFQTEIKIAQAAVKASQAQKQTLNNRIQIIQNKLQLVLTEKDDLEQAFQQNLQSSYENYSQLVKLQEKYQSMETSYQQKLNNVTKSLKRSEKEKTMLEVEKRELKKSLMIELKPKTSERKNYQTTPEEKKEGAATTKRINSNEVYLNSLNRQENTQTNSKNEISQNGINHSLEASSKSKGGRLRRLWKKMRSPKSWKQTSNKS